MSIVKGRQGNLNKLGGIGLVAVIHYAINIGAIFKKRKRIRSFIFLPCLSTLKKQKVSEAYEFL